MARRAAASKTATMMDIDARRPDTPGATGDESIYRGISAAILEHRLPPGTRLAEDALGEIFGVSRTVVRKALFRLAHDKIVEIRPNRGAAVASPTIGEARDVFDTRRTLERAVIEAACETADRVALEDLRRLTRAEEAAHAEGDRQSVIRHSGDFHLRLAEIAGNAVMGDFLRELISRTALIIALYERAGPAACAAHEHMALIDAIEDGDTAAAVALMDTHLNEIEASLNLDGGEPPVDLRDVFAGVGLATTPRRS